jgi:hypothetical protein
VAATIVRRASVNMNWADEPAAENQLSRLWQLGCTPDHTLTKREAARLIADLEEHPEKHTAQPVALAEEDIHQTTRHEAYRLRVLVENGRRAVAPTQNGGREAHECELALATAKRQEFWVDTCREAQAMRSASKAVLDLYRRYGCRFMAPTGEQVQCILDALDSAMPLWDRDHPELFYETLQINFRELLRRP